MNKCYTMILVLLFLVLMVGLVSAYHPGTQHRLALNTNPEQLTDPGNTPIYIVIFIIIAIAGLIYWHINYGDAK